MFKSVGLLLATLSVAAVVASGCGGGVGGVAPPVTTRMEPPPGEVSIHSTVRLFGVAPEQVTVVSDDGSEANAVVRSDGEDTVVSFSGLPAGDYLIGFPGGEAKYTVVEGLEGMGFQAPPSPPIFPPCLFNVSPLRSSDSEGGGGKPGCVVTLTQHSRLGEVNLGSLEILNASGKRVEGAIEKIADNPPIHKFTPTRPFAPGWYRGVIYYDPPYQPDPPSDWIIKKDSWKFRIDKQ